MRLHQLVVAVGLFLLVGSIAWAAPPMGMAVPLPEALPPHTFEVQIDVHGPAVLQAQEAKQQLGLQFGLENGWEIGADVRLGSHFDGWPNAGYRNWELRYNPEVDGYENVFLNVKKQLVTENSGRPAVAAGLLNLSGKGPTGKYLIAGKHWGYFQVTLGWAKAYHENFYTQTLSYQSNPDWKYMFEHITGGRFSTNLGVRYRLNDELSLTAGWMRANNDHYDDAAAVNLTYRGDW